MAFFRLRPGNHVYVYHWNGSKQVTLPRKITKHLDGQPLPVIEEWVNRWSNLNEVQKLRPDLSPLPPAWEPLIDRFCENQLAKGRQPSTVKDHRRHLFSALPFFVDSSCVALADFPEASRKLGPWLIKTGKIPRRIHAINQSMRLFWEFLDGEGLAEGVLKLTAGHKTANRTPLKKTVAPEELFDLFTRPDIRLLALLGYFFSLRPQETLALRPCDFRVGSKAAELECCKVLTEAGLYGRLAVNIHRQKTSNGLAKPKKNSFGWVACFDEKAAKEIVRVLASKDLNEPLFGHGAFWYIKLWKRYGLPNSVLKDLRRASLYHLGHYSKLPVTALKNHARHSSIETTMLYTRRPEELNENDQINFDLDA